VESGSRLLSVTEKVEAAGPVVIVPWLLQDRMAWSPDGSRVAASLDRGGQVEVRVWDVATGREVLALDRPLAGDVGSNTFQHLAPRSQSGGEPLARVRLGGRLPGGTTKKKCWGPKNGKDPLAPPGAAPGAPLSPPRH